MKQTVCKWCGEVDRHFSFQCSKRPRKETVAKPRKAIKQRGKHWDLWQKTRAEFVKQNPDAKCSFCGGEATDVDHKIKRSVRPDLRYEMSNLQWLCRRCHNLKDNGIG